MAGEYRHRQVGKDARTMAIGHTLPTHKLVDIELPERYKLLRHVADGGMASVWCAHDSVLSRKVAIKILSPEFRHDTRAVRCFEREARAAARLSGHRNIVTIYDVGEARLVDQEEALGPAFIVMEHLAGGTVADALRVGNVSRDQARRWIHEAAAALDYAHGHGVVHCDVTPANLLLDNQRVVHIADFGIARIATEDTLAHGGQLFGTAAYLSPEQAGGASATEASDRYALAVVAFELLVGERPFSAEGFMNTARRHLDEDPPAASVRRADLPRTLDPVLERGMAKRQQDRWPTAASLASAIDAALYQRRVTFARPAPTRQASPAPARTVGAMRGRSGALAALAFVALLAGVAFGLNGQGSHPRAVAQSSKPATPRRVQVASVTPVHRRPSTHKAIITATTEAPAAPVAPSPATLESEGHSLMLAGSYSSALPILEQALHSAAPGSLVYQWALYDIAHSYREMGDLGTAIALLQERMRYPDARPVVQKELSTALALDHKPTAPKRKTAAPKPTHPSPAKHSHGRH